MGFIVRIFLIAFTKDMKENQVKIFTYAQAAQIKKIRAQMVQTVQQVVSQGQLKDLVKHLVIDKIESDIKNATNRIYPLDPVHIHKVKVIKRPQFDVAKLMEIHDKGSVETDNGVQMEEAEEAKNLLAQ